MHDSGIATFTEIAKAGYACRTTLTKWDKAGILKTRKVGNLRLVVVKHLDEVIAAQLAKAQRSR